MEDEDGGAYTMGSDALALSYSQKAGVIDAGSVDLVGRLKALSSDRKKLMTKYFDLEEVESGPLLAEYFAVSLAFVALGAMIREANVRMRRKEKGDSADGVSPKLQRLALDSMLKSAMERLRGLARRTQTLEAKVRDRSYMEAAFQFERMEFLKRISALEGVISKHGSAVAKSVDAEAAWRKEKDDLVKRIADVDAQRGYFFKKMAEAEGALADMQRLRMEDGKANAKLVEIYAGREQSWKSERLKMRHEIDLLKEKLSKVQPRMKSPRSLDAAAEALRMRNLKRRAKEMVREKVVSELEFASFVAVEPSLKPEPDLWSLKEFPSGPSDDGNTGSLQEAPVPVDDRRDLEGADIHELSAAQNQEMEAELAIILKRVGALKRRGASGGKLDELLNEAKGKPKLKRLGSFDQTPSRGTVVDDTFLGNSLKDVEIDKEDAKDIWQAIELQEGKNSDPRGNGLVDQVRPADSNSSRRSADKLAGSDHDTAHHMSVLESTELSSEKSTPKPVPLEKSSSPRTPHWLTVVDSDRDLEIVAVKGRNITEGEPRDLGDGGGNWEEFVRVKPVKADENDDSVRESWEELIQESPTTPKENSSSERDGWEGFIQEKLNFVENNISERTPDGSTDPDSGAMHSKMSSDQTASEPLNLREDGWVESIEDKKQYVKGYSVTCSEPVSCDEGPVLNDPVGNGVDDLTVLEDDIKSEILVGSGGLEEVQGELSSGSGGKAEATAQEIDVLCAESGDSVELPGLSPAHDVVEDSVVSSLDLPEDDIKSEIIVSNPSSSSSASDSDHISASIIASDSDHFAISHTALDSDHISTSTVSDGDHISTSTASDGDHISTSTTSPDSDCIYTSTASDGDHISSSTTAPVSNLISTSTIASDSDHFATSHTAVDSDHISTSFASDGDNISTSTTSPDSDHIYTSTSSDSISHSTTLDGNDISSSTPLHGNDISRTTTPLGSDNTGTSGQLNRPDLLERRTDGVSDNCLSSTALNDGQNLQIAKDDLNISVQHRSPSRTSPQLSPGRIIVEGLELELEH